MLRPLWGKVVDECKGFEARFALLHAGRRRKDA